MKDLVYNEITKKNQGWSEDNKFCTGKVEVLITFEDGTHELREVGLEVLDASGNPIAENFPRFGETFYLRYKTTLDEEIRYIRPSIQINHLKKLSNNGTKYEVYTYKSKHIKYSMIEDNGGLFEKSLQEIVSRGIISAGYNITARAYTVNGHWEIYFNYDKNLKGTPDSVSNGVKTWLDIIMSAIADNITKIGQDWGLNNVKVNPDYKPCLYWNNQYFENLGCNINSRCTNRHWEREVTDELTRNNDH